MTHDALALESDEWSQQDYDTLSEAYAFFESLNESDLIPFTLSMPVLNGGLQADCMKILQFLNGIEEYCTAETAKLRIESLKAHYKTSLKTGFCYEFSQGDLERVQTLVNSLRDLIAVSKTFEKDHQRRLLARLEKLQSELHKRVSDLDRFWGLIGDAGVVLGKFGEDAKPMVDRIKEIADIVWQTQSRAEELPSGTPIPLLENKSEIKPS